MWGVRWYAAKDDEPLGFADVSSRLEAGELKIALESTGWKVETWEFSPSGLALAETLYQNRQEKLIS